LPVVRIGCKNITETSGCVRLEQVTGQEVAQLNVGWMMMMMMMMNYTLTYTVWN